MKSQYLIYLFNSIWNPSQISLLSNIHHAAFEFLTQIKSVKGNLTFYDLSLILIHMLSILRNRNYLHYASLLGAKNNSLAQPFELYFQLEDC